MGGENAKWDGECVGQALGWLQDAAATPGRPRRVACATEGRRWVAETRRQDSAPVTDRFLKTTIQCLMTMTDRAGLTMISS